MKLLLDADAAAVERARLPLTVQQWLEAEQSHLGPRVDRRRIAAGEDPGLDPRLLPAARPVFRLPAFWAHAPSTLGAEASPLIRRTFLSGKRALCLVHPLNPAARADFEVPLFASPTASIRTLLVWHADRPRRPFFAKLSLPALLGGERRTLRADTAAACVRRSSLLRAFGAKGLVPLAETLAVAASTGAFLIRELPARTRLTPWFALNVPGQLDALARLHKMSPAAFVRTRLLRPFLRAWMTSAIEHGWTSDAHAQNLLLERTRAGLLTGRFFVRDLEDAAVDLPFIATAHPKLRPLAAALDTRVEQDFTDSLEQSLHGFFLSGPVHALRARRAFFEELGAPRDPRAFRAWVEEARERQLRPPKPPRKLGPWLHLEQRVNAQRRSPRHFAPVDLRVIPPRFLPSNQPVFRLPYFEVPLKRVRVRADEVPPVLRRALFVRPGLVRCFFHPLMAEAHALDVAEHGQGLDTFWATATASPRSLVVWRDGHPDAAFGLKVSLDLELLRLNRLLESSKLERAVAVNGCLKGAEVMREPISIRQRDKRWGTIARVLPRDLGRWVPGFSFFEQTRHTPEQLEPSVLRPLVQTFARLAFGEGLLPDLHQQNVLFNQGRVAFRDLDSCKCDLELRWRRGKTLEPFARSAGTLKDLKLDVGSSHYDQAWGHSLRADWAWLAQDALLRHGRDGRRLWATFDRLILEETARWLGARAVDDELRRLGARALSIRGDPQYSLNAIVHAWKLRQPPPPANGSAALRSAFRQLAKLGRATAELGRSDRVSRSNGLLVATDRRGTVRGLALELLP